MHDPYSKPSALIRRLQQISARIFMEETAAFNMTSVQFGALNVIADRPGIDQISLSWATDVDHSSIMRVIDRLQASELVRKETSPEDRRKNRLYITEQGKRLIDEATAPAESSQDRLMAPLTVDESAEFMRLMTKLVHSHIERKSPSTRRVTRARQPTKEMNISPN